MLNRRRQRSESFRPACGSQGRIWFDGGKLGFGIEGAQFLQKDAIPGAGIMLLLLQPVHLSYSSLPWPVGVCREADC